MIGAGLSAPTDSVGGIVAATVSPAIAYEIGQQFKANGTEGSAGHLLAHAVLGAAVAAAGGNNAMTGAISAAGSEAIIPVVSQWLYGTKDPEQLTADQKDTLSSIASLVGAGTGALVGDGVADVVSGSGAGQNAVENNYLTKNQLNNKYLELTSCESTGNPSVCIAKVNQKYNAISIKQDKELAVACQENPSGSVCKNDLATALDYVGDDRKNEAKKSDIKSSTKNVLDAALYNAYNDIDGIEKRADFFGAMHGYTGQPWFREAEKVSRDQLQGLMYGVGNFASQFFSKNTLNQWREEAGKIIMQDGKTSFQQIYQNPNDSYDWSKQRLHNEQNDPKLQKIHEKHFNGWDWFTKKAANYKSKKGILNSGDFLNPKVRIEYGCQGMPEVKGCVK